MSGGLKTIGTCIETKLNLMNLKPTLGAFYTMSQKQIGPILQFLRPFFISHFCRIQVAIFVKKRSLARSSVYSFLEVCNNDQSSLD